nr:hypothetical protein [Mycolicibacterium sp. CBMA 226]
MGGAGRQQRHVSGLQPHPAAVVQRNLHWPVLDDVQYAFTCPVHHIATVDGADHGQFLTVQSDQVQHVGQRVG